MNEWNHRIDWLRRTTRRISPTEITIAGFVFVLLLLTIFPVFRRAQVVSRVAKNKHDLVGVSHTIMNYILDFQKSGFRYLAVTQQDKPFALQYGTFSKMAFIRMDDPLFKEIKKLEISTVESMIIELDGTACYRQKPYLIYGPGQGPMEMSLITNHGWGEDQEGVCYQSFTAGPLLDARVENAMTKFRMITYDPSNGTLSHGYLIYEATPERTNKK